MKSTTRGGGGIQINVTSAPGVAKKKCLKVSRPVRHISLNNHHKRINKEK